MALDKHQPLVVLQKLCVDVVVACAKEQVLTGVHHTETLFLADLIVERKLAGLHRLLAELGHSWSAGNVLPIVVAAIQAIGEDILYCAKPTEQWLSKYGFHPLVNSKIDSGDATGIRVVYQQDVLPGNPDVLAFHLDRQHPPLRVFRLTLVGRRTDGEVSLVINKTFESVGPEPDLVLRTEGDDHRTIPETAFPVFRG